MTINHSEIEAIIGHIEAHPEEWDQRNWASRSDCGTAYCLAGLACVRSGGQAKFYRGLEYASTCSLPDGRTELIVLVAQDLLGLTNDQADILFDASNTIDDLKRIAKSFHDNEQS